MKKLAGSLAAFVVLALSGIAVADLAVKDGSGANATMFDFLCFTTKHCSTSVIIKADGTEIGTAMAASLASIDTKASGPLPAQTPNNVNIGAVMSAGSMYETVAASQTAQVLGPTGGTGDYLSHCVIYPVTTGAGAVTVFDNTSTATTNVITFATGTLSNLAPIAVPVGAVSTAGAWKATTGANVTVTCYGKFT